MRFIGAVLEYEQFLGEIFLGQNSFSLGNGTSELEVKKSVGQYLGESLGRQAQVGMIVTPLTVRVLDALSLNMEHKARNFESTYLAALFLLNNYQFVLKTFTQ